MPLPSGRSAPRWLETKPKSWLETKPKAREESPDAPKPENETDRLAVLAIDRDARVLRTLAHQLIDRFSLHTARDTSSGHVLIQCLTRIDLVFVDAHLAEFPGAPLLIELARAHPLAARVLLCRVGDCSLSPTVRQWSHLLMWKPLESATLRAVENAVLWHPSKPAGATLSNRAESPDEPQPNPRTIP